MEYMQIVIITYMQFIYSITTELGEEKRKIEGNHRAKYDVHICYAGRPDVHY